MNNTTARGRHGQSLRVDTLWISRGSTSPTHRMVGRPRGVSSVSSKNRQCRFANVQNWQGIFGRECTFRYDWRSIFAVIGRCCGFGSTWHASCYIIGMSNATTTKGAT